MKKIILACLLTSFYVNVSAMNSSVRLSEKGAPEIISQLKSGNELAKEILEQEETLRKSNLEKFAEENKVALRIVQEKLNPEISILTSSNYRDILEKANNDDSLSQKIIDEFFSQHLFFAMDDILTTMVNDMLAEKKNFGASMIESYFNWLPVQAKIVSVCMQKRYFRAVEYLLSKTNKLFPEFWKEKIKQNPKRSEIIPFFNRILKKARNNDLLCVSCLKEIVTMYPAKAELYEYYIESLEESTQRVPASSTNLKEYSKNRILIMLLKDYLGSYVKTYSRYEPFIKKIREDSDVMFLILSNYPQVRHYVGLNLDDYTFQELLLHRLIQRLKENVSLTQEILNSMPEFDSSQE